MRLALLATVLCVANVACGGGAEEEPPKEALKFYKNCLYEWGLPGVPGTGGPIYRCYYTSACKTTDVCDSYPEFLRSQCPYMSSSCDLCPSDKPLGAC